MKLFVFFAGLLLSLFGCVVLWSAVAQQIPPENVPQTLIAQMIAIGLGGVILGWTSFRDWLGF